MIYLRAIAVILSLGLCVVGITGMIWVLIDSGIEVMGGE